ncbi:MAG TPA: hypothetical protein VGT01_05555 [Candidatus Dormibacteraeota bacterium]|nr:hypothetical protein [Candidatus Dormibacteraeota bacterium]
MRRGLGLAGLLATTILLVIVGVIAYNVGWSDGVNTHLPAATAAGDGAPYYYYGPHFGGGFGFFGILWFLLILFGIFWLFRLAFWGFFGRRMWGGGWGYGRGFGKGWGYGPGGPGQGMPHRFDEMAQEWHRRQHGEQPPATGETPPPPPTDTRSV